MPRDTLTREQIVKTAIFLLDAEGLEGLNMRSLGQRLSSAATAVYWHVGSKENLIALAGDEVWNEIRLPDPDAVGWRTAAEVLAIETREALTRHPWMVQAFGSILMFGPGKARHDDRLLAVYEAAGFTEEQADRAAAAVFTFVLGNALGPAAEAALIRKLDRDGGDAEEMMSETVAKAGEIASQYPRLRSRLQTAAAEYGATPDYSFEFGLQALLDGMQAQLDSARAELS